MVQLRFSRHKIAYERKFLWDLDGSVVEYTLTAQNADVPNSIQVTFFFGGGGMLYQVMESLSHRRPEFESRTYVFGGWERSCDGQGGRAAPRFEC